LPPNNFLKVHHSA